MATGHASQAGAVASVQHWISRNAPAIGILVIALVLWQIFAQFFNPRGNAFFPSPTYTIEQTMANTDLLIAGLQTTVTEIVVGYVFAVVFGISMGILLTEIYTVRHMSLPLVLFFHSIPLAILAPLFLGWFGTGIVGIGIFVAWGGFFPVFINTITGLTQFPPEFNLLSEITGATKLQRLYYIKIWAALPHISTGMKIAANLAVVGAVIAEFIASGSGLGFTIVFAEQRALAGLMFGTIFLIILVGVIWFTTVSYLIDRLNPVRSV